MGSILVCVNPYQPLAIYGDDLLRTYHSTVRRLRGEKLTNLFS